MAGSLFSVSHANEEQDNLAILTELCYSAEVLPTTADARGVDAYLSFNSPRRCRLQFIKQYSIHVSISNDGLLDP